MIWSLNARSLTKLSASFWDPNSRRKRSPFLLNLVILQIALVRVRYWVSILTSTFFSISHSTTLASFLSSILLFTIRDSKNGCIMDRQLPMKIGNQKTKHHSYSMVGKVGNGNFGEAYLVESALDNRRYIMKRISLENRSTESKEQILKEIKLMQQLNHCYVVKYRESFVKGKSVCIVMEYAEKGDLEKELEVRRSEGRPLTESQAIEWFIQLALGMKYIHEKKILHRDLKADNIFITSANQMKIGDFGISKLMSETFDLAKTKIGTPFVMAPEIWEDRRYNQKSDIWSLGCVLHKMLTLRYPFQAENSGALLCKLMARKIPIIHGNYSEELKGLVLSMLDFQPQRRPSVHKILEMPFIKKHLCQTLEKTISLYDQNIASNDNLKRSSSAHRLLRKRDSASLSGSLLPARQSSQQYLKIVEYKQNYPVIQQQNRCLKQEIEKQRSQREQFEQSTQALLRRLRESSLDKDEVLSEVQQHILNYLYP